MGGKSSTTTQQVSIPPEVLARYNAVNARAEQAAGTPFQPYSYNPADFVAQMTPTQLAGIQNINYAAGQAQPYYDEATGQLMGAQQAAVPYYGAAADIYGQAYYGAQPLNQMALQQYYGGLGAAEPLSQQALANLAYGQAQGQQLTGGALSGLGAAQAAAYPYQQLATQYAGAGAAPISPGYLNTMAYMTPYMQNVISPTMALLNQQNQQAMAGQTANAIRAGAFGGDRAAIAAANLAQQQQLASGKVLGDLLQSGYGQALATAQQQQQLGLSAEQANRAAQAAAAGQMLGIGQQGFGQSLETARQQQAAAQALFGQGATAAERQAALAQQLYGQQVGVGSATQGLAQQLYQQGLGLGQAQQGVGKELYGMGAGTAQQLAALGQGAQAAALQGAQAQLGAGQAQQQTAQAGLQALYNQYLQQQGYPFQVAQFLANVAMGTGALSGSTTTTNQPGGLFSDERVKENIRRIGKTEDGQPIYAYNYKGDPKEHTQIGLIAQEVEGKHPEAVGLAGGIKTVNYDKATRKAAGLARHNDIIDGEYTAKEGGHVHPEHAGLGFADGGMPYGMPGAGGLNIPTEMDGPKKLQTPGAPGAGKSVAGDIKDLAETAKAGKELYDTGSKLASFMGFADGGMPYGDPNPTKLDIPDEKPDIQKLDTPGPAPKGRTVMEDVMDIAKVAAMFMSHGGRAGYADGGSPGLVSPADMAALLQAQAQMFGPYSQFNRPMGGAPGGAGVVPAAALPVSSLAVAKGDLPRQPTLGEMARSSRETSEDLSKLWKQGSQAAEWAKGKLEKPSQYTPVSQSDLDQAIRQQTYDIKDQPLTLARGGLAGRHGYANGFSVEDNPDIYSFDTPSVGGGQTNQESLADRLTRFTPKNNGESIADRLTRMRGRNEQQNVAAPPPVSPESGGVTDWLKSAYQNVQHFGQSLRPGVDPNSSPYEELFAGKPKPGLGSAVITPPAPAAAVPTSAAATNVPKPERRVPRVSRPTGVAPPGAPAAVDTNQPSAAPVAAPTGVEPPAVTAAPQPVSAPAGLSPPVVQTAQPAAAQEPQKKSMAEWVKGLLTNQETAIPIITGVTNMIMAPTRNPLVAAAYGLQSGVEAYQPTLQRQAELAKTKAQTAAREAQTFRETAGIPSTAMLRDSEGMLWGVRVFGPNNEVIVVPAGEFLRRRRSGENFRFTPSVPGVTAPTASSQTPISAPVSTAPPSAAPSAAPAVATPTLPTPAVAAPAADTTGAPAAPTTAAPQAQPKPSAPIYSQLPDDLAQDAIARADSVFMSSPRILAADKTSNPFDAASNEATVARNTRAQRDSLAVSLADSGKISGKFAAQFANPIAEYLETALRSFGLPPGIIRDPALLADEQEVRKITNQLAQTQQAAIGGTAFRELVSLMESIPTIANTPEGQAKLLAGLYIQNQRGIDRDRFFNLMRDTMENKGGLTRDLSMLGGRGLENEFAKRQDPIYQTEKNVLSKMFLTKIEDPSTKQPVSLLSYLIKNGAASASDKDLIKFIRQNFNDKNYDAAEILRYFAGT